MIEWVGVISDTHGLLRGDVLPVFTQCRLILHAGDTGKEQVLQALVQAHQVVAVRGNVDSGLWAERLKKVEKLQVQGKKILLIHNIQELKLPAGDSRADIVIFGHSHRPLIEQRDGVLYLNPGSAGPRRFHLLPSVALLRFQDGSVFPELVSLEP